MSNSIDGIFSVNTSQKIKQLKWVAFFRSWRRHSLRATDNTHGFRMAWRTGDLDSLPVLSYNGIKLRKGFAASKAMKHNNIFMEEIK